MKLPNAEAASIPKEKIVDYLLSSFHKDGKGKADFFKRFGFTVELWHILAEALVKQALENEVMKKENTPFGTRYVVEGDLERPGEGSGGLVYRIRKHCPSFGDCVSTEKRSRE